MDPLTPAVVITFMGCAWACVTDLRDGKILNILTLPMMLLGLFVNGMLGHWQLPVTGILGAFALYWPLWKLRLQHGGDAKLWMGIGALLGPWFMLEASAWYALLYVPVGLLVLLFKGRLGNLFNVVGVTRTKHEAGKDPPNKPEPTMLRTAPVITAAVALAYCTHWLEQAFGWLP